MTETTQELLARLVGFKPAPWKWHKSKRGSLFGIEGVFSIEQYYDSAWIEFEEGESDPEANADLILAAPDLHRIVTEQAAQIERMREALVVIAQAKAITNPNMNLQTIWNVTERARAALAVKP